jgi:hypothetical protein
MAEPKTHRREAPISPTPAPKVPLIRRGAALGSALALGVTLGAACGEDETIMPPPREDSSVRDSAAPDTGGGDSASGDSAIGDTGTIDAADSSTASDAGDTGIGVDTSPPPPMPPPPVDAG